MTGSWGNTSHTLSPTGHRWEAGWKECSLFWHIVCQLTCVFNGVERFFIEKIRVNAEMDLLGMAVTQAELISTITFLAGVVLWFLLGRKTAGTAR